MNIRALFRTERRVWLSYFLVYITAGFIMNGIGQYLEIAKFANWWQVITCYGLYLVPVSLIVKHRSSFDQYLLGLLFLGLLELGGYTFQTSIPYPGNFIDTLFTERNFSLAMTLFFAGLLPVGNCAMRNILKIGQLGQSEEGQTRLNAGLRLSKTI